MFDTTRRCLTHLLICAATLVAATGCSTAPKSTDRASFMVEAEAAKVWFTSNISHLQQQLDNSAGYILFPAVGQWGFVFLGGQFGRGAVYTAQGQQVGWGKVNSGSLGLQLGGQAVKMLVVFQDDATMTAFKSGSWQGGAGATAVAANSGGSAAAPFSNGLAIYLGGNAGLMAGASISLSHLAFVSLDDADKE